MSVAGSLSDWGVFADGNPSISVRISLEETATLAADRNMEY